MPICKNVLQFGDCASNWSCKGRHVFIESDKPINIPCDGLVKFDICGVRNPSHFIIKIREYLPDGENAWVSRENMNRKVQAALKSFQETMKKCAVIHVSVKPNDLCAYFKTEDIKWYRCRVLEKE